MLTSNSKAKLFLLLAVSGALLQPSVSQSIVKFLPGFQGPLPFYLETGYIGVGESDDVQLFYYFIKSDSNPKEDPVLLWLTGGPGCTSLSALFYELGPLNFEEIEYNGSLPILAMNPYSWTQVSSIIFLDQPVGAGFSYATTPQALEISDLQACDQTYQFVTKWLINHPEFISNPFYVGGDSYSGITVPITVQIIANGNEAGIQPQINLKGYILGNPVTFPAEDNFAVPYAHGMGLISDELYESLQKNCGGEYQDIDPSNSKCLQNVQAFGQVRRENNNAHILEPVCGFALPEPEKLFGGRRSLNEELQQIYHPQLSLAAFRCRVDGLKLSYYWSNDKTVQEALHIRKGTIEEWQRCNYGLPYTHTTFDVLQYHANLSSKSYRSLIYSGDHDMVVTFISTQAWIRSLNYSIVDDWRSWIIDGQVGGYTRTYSNGITFATVKGGGHTAEFKMKECSVLFTRWISHQPL